MSKLFKALNDLKKAIADEPPSPPPPQKQPEQKVNAPSKWKPKALWSVEETEAAKRKESEELRARHKAHREEVRARLNKSKEEHQQNKLGRP